MEDNAKSLPYLASMSYPYSILSNTSAPNYYPKNIAPRDRSHPPSPQTSQQQQQQQPRYPYRPHPHHPAMGYPPKPYHPSSPSYPYLSYLQPYNSHYYNTLPSSLFHSSSAKLQELSNRLQSWKTISIVSIFSC